MCLKIDASLSIQIIIYTTKLNIIESQNLSDPKIVDNKFIVSGLQPMKIDKIATKLLESTARGRPHSQWGAERQLSSILGEGLCVFCALRVCVLRARQFVVGIGVTLSRRCVSFSVEPFLSRSGFSFFVPA